MQLWNDTEDDRERHRLERESFSRFDQQGRKLAAAFGDINGWEITSDSFTPDSIGFEDGYWNFDAYWRSHGWMDDPLYFKEKRTGRCIAIVGQPYARSVDSHLPELNALTERHGLCWHVPPNPTASIRQPGQTLFIIVTSPDTKVNWLPEQMSIKSEPYMNAAELGGLPPGPAKFHFDNFEKYARAESERRAKQVAEKRTNSAGEISDTNSKSPPTEGLLITDFVAYMPGHSYIYIPTREHWPGSSVNARLGPHAELDKDGKIKLDSEGAPVLLKANTWLDQNRPVEQMTWAPGEPLTICDRLISDGGWFEQPRVTVFNLYRPPTLKMGNAKKAGPWLDHVHTTYPDDADAIITRLAFKVQRPGEKINHGFLLGGPQGIGKDTILEPVKYAVGAWNFKEVSPREMLAQWTDFGKSVILRINELRDLGDSTRFEFYERMKPYHASPPDVLRINEKHIRAYYVNNCCFVVATTNYKDSVYLPADDRRNYVVWSYSKKEDFNDNYWNEMWSWYYSGGFGHVAAYLATLDVSAFDPKALPPKTPIFYEIVNLNRAPEDAELADVIETLGNPQALTLEMMAEKVSANGARGSFFEYLTDRKNGRSIAYRLNERCYVSVDNPSRADGLWRINGKRQTAYAREELCIRDRHTAIHELTKSYGAAGG